MILDLDGLCKTGGDIYTATSVAQFIGKIFGIRDISSFTKPELHSYSRFGKHLIKTCTTTNTYHISITKKTICRNGKTFPIVNEEDQHECDLLCIFLGEMIRQYYHNIEWSQ